MAILPFINNTATIGTTEFSLPNNANYSSGSPMTTVADVQTVIDFSALLAGDRFQVQIYERVNGGTQRPMFDPWVVDGVQAQLYTTPKVLLGDGWDVTVKKLAGTDRSVRWSVRQNTNEVSVGSIVASAITATSIASAAITSTKFATDAIDSTALAASAVTEIQTGLATSTALATAQSDLTTLTGRLTSGRAGFLDNLNVGGNVASSAEVVSIQNNTRVVRVVPNVIERPDTGTTTYRVELLLYDSVGNMEAPDSAPTVALVNQAGTSLAARLDSTTMALVSTGRYRCIYTADAADALEQLVWTFSVVEGGTTRLYGNGSIIVDTSAVDFTSSDRTLLTTLATDYTTARAAKIDNLDVVLSTRASGSALATTQADTDDIQTRLTTLQADTDDIQTRLPAALVGGKMSSDVGTWLGTTVATPTVAGIPKAEVSAIGAGSITSTTFAAGAITAASIASNALTAIADAIFAFVVESGAPVGARTFLQRLRIKWSVFAGKAGGLAISTAGTENFRDAADTKNRATFTLATDGSRTPGTLDGD